MQDPHAQPAGYDGMRGWESGSMSCDEKPSINFNPVKAEPSHLALTCHSDIRPSCIAAFTALL